MSRSRLLSGRVPKRTGPDLDAARYEFLDLANAEPDLGQPNFDGAVLISDADGSRYWTDNIRIDLTGNIYVGTISNSDGSSAIRMLDNVLIEENLTIEGILSVPSMSVSTINTADSSPLTVATGLNVEGDLTVSDFTVKGNLTVQGTTTTINSTTLTVADKNIELASGATTSASADGAGITVSGPTVPANIIYDGQQDRWKFNKDIETPGTVFADKVVVYDSIVGNFEDAITEPQAIGIFQQLITEGIDSTDSSPINFIPAVIMQSDLTVENDLIVRNTVTASRIVGYLDGSARDIDNTAITNKEFATELDANLDQVFVYDVSEGQLKKTYLSEIVSQGANGFTGSQGNAGYTGSSGDPGYTGSQGLGLDEWIKIAANYIAESGNRIIADTTAGAFTITLPVAPYLGTYIVLTDGGDWSINNLTISAGGASIEGYTEDVIIDIGGVTTELLWDGTMWQITATLGAAGNPGPGVPDGGTTGQVLAKVSNTDYDTDWVNPTGGGANLGSLEVTGSRISTTDSSPVTIDGSLIVDGDLLPESDSLYDLGSPTKKWHSLYVSGNSIYINGTALTVDQNGDLLVGGQLPQSNISALDDIPDVVVSGATVGQVLGYTGSNWTATTVEGGGGGADSYVKTYFWEGALQENVSLKRFYIHVTSTLEKITVNLGTAGLTQSTIQIKRNGQVLNSIVIPANTAYLLETVNHPLAVNDYLTVDITQSSSAANLYVTFVYRE